MFEGDGQTYNTSGSITKPSTVGVQSIVQYSSKGATSELNATGYVLEEGRSGISLA
jgi:hypothetical protein